MSTFAQWIIGYAKTFLALLYNKIIELLQFFSDSVADFLVSIVALFPVGEAVPSYSGSAGTLFDIFCNALNWLFPLAFMKDCVVWLSAGMMLYLVVAPLARWAKLLK